MAENTEDVVDIHVDSMTRLVSDVLTLADAEGLESQLELPRLRKAFAEEFVGLMIALGATVEIQDETIDASSLPTARMLVPGTRVHVRIRRLSWTTALSLVPIIGGVIATGGALPLLGAPALLIQLKDAVTHLDERDKALVVTVKALERSLSRPVTAREVHDSMPRDDNGSSEETDDALRRLANNGVLAWTADGYRSMF